MFEDRFIFFPTRELAGTPADLGLTYRDVTFIAADGIQLHGWLFPGQRAMALLWLHGNGGNISHRLDNLAVMNRRLGVSILIFDYRGYGRSEGRPTERGTYEDAQAALACLRSTPEVEGMPVVLFGRSLGGAVAVDLAVSKDVEGVVLESTFASMARRTYPFLPVGLVIRTKYDSLSKIGRLAAPLLVLHSRDDEVVPYEEGVKLYEGAHGPKSMHTIVGAGHNDTYLRGGESYWRALDDFLGELEGADP